MALEERDLFDDRNEVRSDRLACPRCRRMNMIRVDDAVTCSACGTKFDIPSQHSLVFLQPGS
jgi:hypothetical protein